MNSGGVRFCWSDEDPLPVRRYRGRSEKWNRRRAHKRQRIYTSRARAVKRLFDLTLGREWVWLTSKTRPKIELTRE